MQFGTFQKVNPRKIWPNEASDFTPWLARDNNISILADAVGLELEIENTEVAVGPYSADILARDVGTDRFVVIENQLTKTDHDHLGKSLTYASVLDAKAVIWVATEFSEEHQKALDWLNDHTTDDLHFYGVTLEVWQIDESKPAIKFNVVSRPLESIRHSAKSIASDDFSDTKKLQFEFWTIVRESLAQTKSIPSLQTPRPQYWFDISLGRSYVHLSMTANTFENKIGVRVYISNKIADRLLPYLEEKKDEIEAEIGEKLIWNPFPEKMDKSIILYREGDLLNKTAWPEYSEWLTKYVVKFRSAFSKRVRDL